MQVQQELERFNEDMSYFEAHRQELLAQYPDRWVAIYDNRVVGTAKDLPRLMAQLEHQGLPTGRVFVEYVTGQDDLLIL
jgi:hypothetical protein